MREVMNRFIEGGRRVAASDQKGVALVEYVLIVALVSCVVIAALVTMGSSMSDAFNTVSNSLKG